VLEKTRIERGLTRSGAGLMLRLGMKTNHQEQPSARANQAWVVVMKGGGTG